MTEIETSVPKTNEDSKAPPEAIEKYNTLTDILEEMYLKNGKSRGLQPLKVAAQNDLQGNETFTEQKSDWIQSIIKENTPTVSLSTDPYGKMQYLFNIGLNRNILVIIFTVGNQRMIKINDVILSLSRFLTLQQCIGIIPKENKKAFEHTELRSKPTPFEFGSVLCSFAEGDPIQIDKITVNEVMQVASYLSQVEPKPTLVPTGEAQEEAS